MQRMGFELGGLVDGHHVGKKEKYQGIHALLEEA